MPGSRLLAAQTLAALALLPQFLSSAPVTLADEPAATLACEQWIVTLKGDFASDFDGAMTASDVAASIGATVSASVPRLRAHVLEACDEHSQQQLATRSDARIALAFPNVRMTPAASSQQWYLHNAGQSYYVGAVSGAAVTNAQALAAGLDYAPAIAGKDIKWQEAMAKFPALRGGGVTVGVVDSGVDATLPELAGRVTSASASINCDLDLRPPQPDLAGHGTAVAGLIAASGANGGLTGVAPDAQILAVQPDCGLADWQYGGVLEFALGVLYASDNAQVVNLSNGINPAAFADYGGPGTASSLYIQSLELYKSVLDDAIATGAIIVAAAGNGGSGNQVDRGFLPGDYLFPASFPNVTSVGSTRSDGTISLFSQWNDRVDVAAPGDDVLTLRSSYVLNCGEIGDYTCFVNLNGTGGAGAAYWVQDGTSFATPLVSGAAVLAKQKWPRLGSNQFEQLVRSTADDGGTAGYDVYFGAGTLNLERLLSYNFAPTITATAVVGAAVPGSDVRIRAQVENMEGDGELASVVADLTPLGLPALPLTAATPGVFESASATIPETAPLGPASVVVTATDAAGAVTTQVLSFEIVAVAPPQFSGPTPNIVGPAATGVTITGPKRGRDFSTHESQVTLAGDASPNIAFIEVNGKAVAHTAGTASWTADVELQEGRNEIEVRGLDLARSAIGSDSVVIVLDQEAPGRVRSLTATAGALCWRAPSDDDVEGYHVYRLDGSKARRIGTTRKKEFAIDGPGTYAVVAEDGAGNALKPTKAASVRAGSAAAFTDLAPNHEASAAVAKLVARGAIASGTTFSPNRAMTRAEFAKLLVLGFGKSLSDTTETGTDVPRGHTLAPYISAAARAGWMRGDGGRFFPDRAITRAEAATMLARARNLPEATTQRFDDTTGEAGLAASALQERGIVRGQHGRFEPARALLRAEAAQMVANAL